MLSLSPQDDVPEAVKKRRLMEVIDTFNKGARAANQSEVIPAAQLEKPKVSLSLYSPIPRNPYPDPGQSSSLSYSTSAHLLLLHQPSPLKPDQQAQELLYAHRMQVGHYHLLLVDGLSKKSESEWVGRTDCNRRVVFPRKPIARSMRESNEADVLPGDHVMVRITEAISANTLRAEPLAHSSIADFNTSQYA